MNRETIRIFRSTIPGALLLAGALLLSGCSQEDEPGGSMDEPTAAVFTAGIQATRTAAGGNEWAPADRIGIFMLAAGGNLTTPEDLLAGNVEHKATPGTPASGASFAPVNTSETIYYPQTDKVDFVAYYPYAASTGSSPGEITTDCKYNLTVAGQTSEQAQNDRDVLYAKTTGVAKQKAPVGLTFGHVLSKIVLNVSLGAGMDGIDGGDITVVMFTGMPQTATLDLQNGALTAGGAKDFPALKGTVTEGSPYVATYTALLVPQPAASGRTVVFTVAGMPYVWTIPDTETFVAGACYAYPLTVQHSGIVVSGEPAITNWRTNDHGTGTAELAYNVTGGTGNFSGLQEVLVSEGIDLPDGTGLMSLTMKPNPKFVRRESVKNKLYRYAIF